MIVAVGDKEIESSVSGSTLLAVASEAGPVRLTVLRAGQRIAITADLREYRDPRRAGGSLHPWVR